jgi:ammonia channel protein AmtB
MYKKNCNRTFFASNISFLMAGTLIILITSLFMNAGSYMKISDDDNSPNVIVMNSIISAASSGLIIGLTNQMSNVIIDDQAVHQRQI